jgi:hypothetical protein
MEIVSLDPLTLTDLDTARAYLKSDTTRYDDIIKAAVNRATAQIEMYCKRYLFARLYDNASVTPGDRPTMKLNGSGCSDIMPLEYPVGTITSIVERYPDGLTTRTLNITGLTVRPGHIIHLPLDTFARGYNNIEVKGTFGYSAATHARERRALEAACLRWVQVMYQDQDAVIGRGTTFGVGGDTVQLISGAMPADVIQAIAPFQRYI